jgi:hypothetical protein
MTEPIFKEEEKAILLSVDKAKASSNNSQVIGRNGELPLLTFLNNYLPPNLKAVTGHFLTPESVKSPQIDILIIDSRYPLLGYNEDGTVLVMAHSVLRIIEIKTNLTTKDLKKTASIFSKTRPLFKTIWTGEQYGFEKPIFELLAYRLTVKENTIENSYFENCNPINNHFDVTILRSQKIKDSGIQLHFNPTSQWKDFDEVTKGEYKNEMKGEYLLSCIVQRTPLADFYYQLIQDSYYTIDHRNYSLGDIGEHFMNYLEWTTHRRE